MAPDDTDGRKPSAPAVLRIKLRYNSVEAMIHRFAPNVGKLGIFLPTRSIHPPGTEIKFELKLITDVPMLVGLGRVMSSHEPDPNNPRAVFGIAVEIIRVTREGRQLLVRLIERRRAMGLPDVAIPIPADIDAARRADIDTQPRAQIPTAGASLLVQQTANVLTAPRITPVPLANGNDGGDRGAVPALTPEPARPPRRRVADVIAAAHPVSTATEDQAALLDHHVDVEGTLARARALASGDLDNELAQLRDANAAPLVDIEIEAASAELARHLGGIAVKRDRSAPVAAPNVGTSNRDPADNAGDPAAIVVADTALDSSPASVGSDAHTSATMANATSDPEPEIAVSETAPDRHRELRHTLRRRTRNSIATWPSTPPIAAEGNAVRDEAANDSDPDSHSDAALPAPNANAEPSATAVEPVEDDDPDLLSFERDLDAARIQTGVTHTPAPPAPQTAEETGGGDDDDVDELDDSELEHLRVITPPAGIAVSPAPTIYPDATAIPDSARDIALSAAPSSYPEPKTLPRGPEGEEISDVDVLAEANEEDDDLLHAHLRRDELSDSPEPAPPLAPEFLDPADLPSLPLEPRVPVTQSAEPVPYAAPPAARSDAFAQYEEAYEDAHYEDASYDAQPSYAATNANRQYPDDFDYDFASRLDLDDDDEPARMADSGSYTFPDHMSAARVVSPPVTLDDPYGLEDALSNLDADSELPSIDRRRASSTRRPPLPGMPSELNHDPSGTAQTPRPRRFATDDGVTIDFDDDDES